MFDYDYGREYYYNAYDWYWKGLALKVGLNWVGLGLRTSGIELLLKAYGQRSFKFQSPAGDVSHGRSSVPYSMKAQRLKMPQEAKGGPIVQRCLRESQPMNSKFCLFRRWSFQRVSYSKFPASAYIFFSAKLYILGDNAFLKNNYS